MELPGEVKLRGHDGKPYLERDSTIDSLTDSCLTVIERSLDDLEFSDDDSNGSCISYDDSTLTTVHNLPIEERELLPLPTDLSFSSSHDEEDGSSFTSYTSDSPNSDGLYLSNDVRQNEWSDTEIPSYTCSSSFSRPSSVTADVSGKSTTLGSEDSGFDERQQDLWRNQSINSSQQIEYGESNQIITATHLAPCSSNKPSKSIADFITRSLFNRNGKRWISLFKNNESSVSSLNSTTSKNCNMMSTSSLIFQQRPCGLPMKCNVEAKRHRQQYNDIMVAVRNKEMRQTKDKRRQTARQHRHEDQLSSELKVWRNEILPNWENTKILRKTKDLWWNGVPASVRGEVWRRAIGNDLNVTSDLYEICLQRAKDKLKCMGEMNDTDSITSVESAISKEGSVELIQLDVSRTFPQLCIFQEGGPYHNLLHNLLSAYVCYRPDVGYVQGMSFVAAVLLLNMQESDAFICFANLLNQPCIIGFFRLDESLVSNYFTVYEQLFRENLSELYTHFSKQEVTSELYVIDWIFTLFARSLPLDVASRVWDVFFRDGESFLFKMSLGILKLYSKELLNLDFIQLAQFLTRLPDSIPCDELFKCVESIRTCIDGNNFSKLLSDITHNC